MADNRYQIITWRGFKFDRYTVFNIEQAQKKLGMTLRVVQGSYNRGGVAASAGTHDGGGAVDFSVAGMSSATIQKVVRALRSQGFAAWYRPPISGVWGPHIHAILVGNDKASAGAKNQVSAYRKFRNGLANNAVDLSWRPLLIRSAPYTVAQVRIAAYNFPDAEKLPNPDERIKAAMRVLKSGAGLPGIIGWNELVGIKKPGHASDFALAVDDALGSKWNLVRPTLMLNENYLSYDARDYVVVHQYGDSILRSASGGRHLTRVVMKHKATGVVFAVGVTHLVNGTTAQHQADRQRQAKAAASSMKKVSAKHADCPWIILGDMNMSAAPESFVKSGMKNARTMADRSDSRTATTYTNWVKVEPSKAASAIIDQIWVSSDFWVHAYAVRQDVTGGRFRQPRPSDHQPVLASISTS